MIPIFEVFGLTLQAIEPESTVSAGSQRDIFSEGAKTSIGPFVKARARNWAKKRFSPEIGLFFAGN